MRKPIPRGRDGSSSQPSSHALYPLASLLLLKPLITFCCPFFFLIKPHSKGWGIVLRGLEEKKRGKDRMVNAWGSREGKGHNVYSMNKSGKGPFSPDTDK